MNRIITTIVAACSLALMIDVASAATAGHFFKSSTPASGSDQDVTGSIKRSPTATGGDVTGAVRKPLPAPNIAKPKTSPVH
jgi:hypothetical protein